MEKPTEQELKAAARAIKPDGQDTLPRLEGELLAKMQSAYWKRQSALGQIGEAQALGRLAALLLERAQQLAQTAETELRSLYVEANSLLEIDLGGRHDWVVPTGEIIDTRP